MPYPPGPNGYPQGFYNVTAPKWCRHKDQYVTYYREDETPLTKYARMTCLNCSADTGLLMATFYQGTSADQIDDALRKLAHDALMKIEKVGQVSETDAP